MFIVKPTGTSVKDFQKCRNELIKQGTTMLIGAADRAKYAFGQKVGHTRWEVERAFKDALRNLDSLCTIANNGVGLNGKKKESLDDVLDDVV